MLNPLIHMNKEREIISKELARTLHYLLTSYKLTVYGDEDFDDEDTDLLDEDANDNENI